MRGSRKNMHLIIRYNVEYKKEDIETSSSEVPTLRGGAAEVHPPDS